jgi:hypothetical protein
MYYNEPLEEYMRSILGYPNVQNNTYNNEYDYCDYDKKNELEKFYPEIYKIIYPMITKRCSSITEPITKELIDDITDEIHSAIEVNNEINLNININNQTKRTNISTNSERPIKKETNIKEPVKESRGENRQFPNRDLRDLIKVLIIRELIGKPNFKPRPPARPPFFDGRPPFPGNIHGPRPPIRPREYPDELYEQY